MQKKNKVDTKSFENKWYAHWQEKGYFESNPNPKKQPYTIVMPPPNVTGILHMGHALNNTIQDILIRKARMEGKEACWVPGTDHASIATEAKVVNMLKEKGIEKSSLTREEFLKYAWEWKEKHGEIIIDQLKHLGISCDWSRNKFTLDEDLSKSVIQYFIKLYDEEYIYRGNRMINWDPIGQTAISDDEVIHKEVDGILYHIKYKISDSNKYVIIATSRPETIMGDVAICVNPNDKRYLDIVEKHAIVPLINKKIPIIQDEYVSMDFGTGCLKVTPAHDINDAKLGIKHKLESIDILNDDGTLNKNAQIFIGEDRFEARKKIIQKLKENNLVVKEEKYKQNIGFSERTNAIVEPKISKQWFIKMEELTKPALTNVLNENIKFHPNKFINMYKSWMNNVKDWCISRQLWWGHRIPAYYLKDGSFVVAENIEKALSKAQNITNDKTLTKKDLKQDEDVLDTWFSSSLWPISVFNGVIESNNEEIKYYYPTNDLVTAPEIIFFWVARMIIAGYKLKNDKPFNNVYFTGIVRDKEKRKMSKSLGNSPDPIKLMDKYGVDGVRSGMLFCAPAGNDLLFDEKLCEQGRNFSNKIWNAFNLIKLFSKNSDKNRKTKKKDEIAIKWFEAKLNHDLENIQSSFKNFRLSEALMIVYKLVWDDFCSWYLEMIKPAFKEKIPQQVYNKTIEFFEILLKILHPFMPFITEEVWHLIKERKEDECLIISSWPSSQKYDQNILKTSEYAFEFITKLRKLRSDNNISNKEIINVYYDSINKKWLETFKDNIQNLCCCKFEENMSDQKNNLSLNIGDSIFYVPIKKNINFKEEQIKIEKEIKYYKEFLTSIIKKLKNEMFINNAPKKVIDIENKKKNDAELKIKNLEKTLESLI
ncbi:MAG: valine--tRNA ligase [Bacteroidetes bacterium]|nr:valine--tRNA ligase [Bacteroidota bacterium]